MTNTLNVSENMFRLLVPATDATPPDAHFVELCGSPWVLTEYGSIREAPTFTCVSYSWGQGRIENMLEGGVMSERTIPAIEATIKASQSRENWASHIQFTYAGDPKEEEAYQEAALKASRAIWIDAFCVPHHEPAKTSCLCSMGAIYSSARQVFVVLSKSCADVFRQIRKTGCLDTSALFVLESDEWITRAWIYQEAVNSQALYFILQDDEKTLVSGLDFLNAIVTATGDYRNVHGIDPFTWAVLHPWLNNLEGIVADYRIAEFAERSAYQLMSAMHQRVLGKVGDHFYAMIGAITIEPLAVQDDNALHPSEYFMRVCEAKGDYSFIYCVAPRSDVLGRHWRPVAGQIPPVISGLLVSGSGLNGCLTPTHLQLKNMCKLVPGAINAASTTATKAFLNGASMSLSPDDMAAAILENLRKIGFSGCGDYLEFEDGFFFPQSTFTRSDDIFVVVSEDVQWTNGGPGLLLRSNGTEINQFCDVGVFVGRFPKTSESVNVG